MGDRIQLHTLLCGILGCPERGDACRAYFQPPASKEIQYPCIVYERSEISAHDRHFTADNLNHDIFNLYY